MTKSDLASAPASPPDPSAAAPAVDDAGRLAAAVARGERRLRVLEEISEIGMRLMRKLEDPPAKDAPRPDPAPEFAKLSRAVRLTIDLERRVEEDLRAILAGEVTAQKRRQTPEQPSIDADEDARQEARHRVGDQLELAIGRAMETESEYFERSAAMDERLQDDEAYDDVRGQPLREVVEQLCKDIGLDPDWSDWTDEGWPEPPAGGPKARSPWSPFHRISPKPMLKQNQNYHQQTYELADPP